MRPRAGGLVRIAVAATAWGAIPLLVRHAGTSPFTTVFWRVVFATATLIPLLASRRYAGEFLRLPWRTRFQLAGQGALLTANWVLFFTGLRLAPVAIAELLAYCGPVFVAVLAPLALRERFDRRILVPLVLALAGTAVIVAPGRLALEGRALTGAVAALGSAFTYAVLIVNGKHLISRVSTVLYMSTEWAVSALLLAPVALLSPQPAGPTRWAALAVLGSVMTALTGLLFLSGLRRVRADRAATLTYLEPVSAVLFAALFLGEPLHATTVAGGALVVAAGLAVARLAPVAAAEEAPIG